MKETFVREIVFDTLPQWLHVNSKRILSPYGYRILGRMIIRGKWLSKRRIAEVYSGDGEIILRGGCQEEDIPNLREIARKYEQENPETIGRGNWEVNIKGKLHKRLTESEALAMYGVKRLNGETPKKR